MGEFFFLLLKKVSLAELCRMFQDRKSSAGSLLRNYNNKVRVAESLDKSQDITIQGFGEKL